MGTRLKSVYLLDLIIPLMIFSVLAIGGWELYIYTKDTFEKQTVLLLKRDQLQKALGLVQEQSLLLQKYLSEVNSLIGLASMDGFVAVLENAREGKPEIASSSNSSQNWQQGIRIKTAQNLVLIGSSNGLISTIGEAQRKFPSIVPWDWVLKRTPKNENLSLELKMVIPDLTESKSLSSHGPVKDGEVPGVKP